MAHQQTQLAHRHTFGVKGNVRDNLWYLDDQSVLYPSGHNLVVHNTEQRTQKFISGTERTRGITAVCVSSNRRYCAVAEQADRAIITVFDLHTLRKRKVLVTNEVQATEFVSICFSQSESKMLLAQGGPPDWNLVYWNWEKAKVVSFVKASGQQSSPIHQCSFDPQDCNVVCVSGMGILKIFRLSDSILKLLPGNLGKRDGQNCLCHAWMADERVVVGTDTGDLLLVDMNGELKAVLQQSPGNGKQIDAIAPTAKGFVCSSQGGHIHVFEKSDKEYYRCTKTFNLDASAANARVQTIAISQSEETMGVSLDNNQLFTLTLSNSDILKSDEMNFEYLASSYHFGKVTGLDVCVRKPLVATCGADRSVRIWNYLDKSLELSRVFPEEAYSISFHPSGLHVLVGFSDKLRLMNLLMDDIRSYREFTIRGCRECRFSNGGAYFAAVNGNTIQIFSTYTFDNIGNLRGHNGKVRSVYWSADDTRIISAGVDGAVYEWKLKDFKRDGESVLKTCSYNSAVCTPDGRTIFAVGSDKKLKEISESQINSEHETNYNLTNVVMSRSGRMLFAGTEAGTVRCYKFPLTGEFEEKQCHNGAVTAMRLSCDDAYLFSVGEDASVFIFDVKDKEGRSMKREKDSSHAEEILVTKSDFEDKNTLMQELRSKVDELTMQNEYQLRLKDLNYSEKIKEVTEKFTADLENDKTKYELLLQEKNDLEVEHEERMKVMDQKHQGEIQELEGQFQTKIMAEVERYHQLVQEKELLNERWEEQNQLLVQNHEAVIRELSEDYENRLQEDVMMLDRLREEKDELVREFDETKRQLEEDADREIEELKERYEAKLAGEREAGLRLKGENGIMRKKFSALQHDIEDQKEEIKTLFEQKKELYQQIASLEKDIAGLKKEIKERDETIGDKEKRIYDLKKKNQELEKFKFVLDYKIKELKKQIEPRELEIADMKLQIQEMDQELERYNKSNSNLELTISELRLKLEALNKEIALQRKKVADTEAVIRRYRTDLHDIVNQYIQNPKMLKENVKQLYVKHVTRRVSASGLDQDIQRENSRQREYLERSVQSLKQKQSKDNDLHRKDTVRIMAENVQLIQEINELRRELKAQKLSQRHKDMERLNGKKVFKDAVTRNNEPVLPRPLSRERLPPLDGFSEPASPTTAPPAVQASS